MCKLMSHLPWLQSLQNSTAVSTERAFPWLTLQHVIKGIGQCIHSLVNVILRPEIGHIQKLSLHILQVFITSAQCCTSLNPTCWRWCKSTLKGVFPEQSDLKCIYNSLKLNNKIFLKLQISF